MEQAPWLCHVCNRKGEGESMACDLCYQVTCPEHLTCRPVRNADSGLYELRSLCPDCAAGRPPR
ncbi:hypothetical protein EDC39_1105 [Geothermobacter ehrlichii]|uniref:Uncharacterized protein n=1 Tax=Geothermobacter ehrlichii TaxID=213224 RepID=A0A5D3WIZ3_9BACT|nr:hypothetical protein [Geothermobacter ehrlichii]TYO97465.1 hypothetical protein EDC39_1105 [Geothermobacter ehrlichii]